MKKYMSVLFTFALLTACVAACAVLSASAYIDPSVMTYTLEAVAGIVIGAGAVFFVWWRKVKKKVADKLGIDENAGKEVEGDLVITDESAVDGAAEAVEAVTAETEKKDAE